MSFNDDYYDFDSDDIINLRLQDYDQYPDTSAGKVMRSPMPASRNKNRNNDDYCQANNMNPRRNRSAAHAGKSRANKNI